MSIFNDSDYDNLIYNSSEFYTPSIVVVLYISNLCSIPPQSNIAPVCRKFRFDSKSISGSQLTNSTYILTKSEHSIQTLQNYSTSSNIAMLDIGCSHDMTSNILLFESIVIFKASSINVYCVILGSNKKNYVLKDTAT